MNAQKWTIYFQLGREVLNFLRDTFSSPKMPEEGELQLPDFRQDYEKLRQELHQLGWQPSGGPSMEKQEESHQPGRTVVTQASTQMTQQGFASETDTRRYQIEETFRPLRKLERHLSQSCRIYGKPCDCCPGHAMDCLLYTSPSPRD